MLGASFIGLEAAASLRHRGLEVTVAAPETLPLVQVFGEEVGRSLRTLHERNGVIFQLGRTVAVVEGSGRVAAVQLDDGTLLPADLVIVGIGVAPATGVVRGVAVQSDGSLLVDEQLRVVGADGVWAAGDVASYPAAHLDGERVRIEHWRVALQQGRVAGSAMAGSAEAFTGVPFFWAQQYERRLGFVGYGRPWEELILAGEPAGGLCPSLFDRLLPGLAALPAGSYTANTGAALTAAADITMNAGNTTLPDGTTTTVHVFAQAGAIGIGRGAFAYPDAPLDLARDGRLDPQKCCVSCSHCTELMRAHVPSGCVVRERGRYQPLRGASRVKAGS